MTRNARQVLPPDSLRQVQEKYPGEMIYVPVAKRRRFKTRGNPQRDEQIRHARAKGASIRELGTQFGLSPSRVHQIVTTVIPSQAGSESTQRRPRP